MDPAALHALASRMAAAIEAMLDQSHICGEHCDANAPRPIGEEARAAVAAARAANLLPPATAAS